MCPSDSREPYVFVSYASADRARVFGIAGVLEAQGIPVWLDRRSITGGRRWTTEIVRGVEDCSVLLVMCSPASVSSRNVQQEVQLAWESSRPMLPVIVEQVELPAELRYALAGQQWVEVRERSEEEWLPELLAALRASGLVGEVAADPASLAAQEVTASTVLEEPSEKKRTHNLPAPRTSFVGRSTQLAEIERALEDHRVVTLTGPGGVGKSRLALELAWRLLPDYPDGVWLVPLETAFDPALVPELVASAAGIRGMPGRSLTLQLADRLAARNALLILDNCEQLLDPCADLAGALAAGGRELRVLATSRELLGMAGEQVVPVSPLQVPAPSAMVSTNGLRDSESVQLFLDRARAVFPAFELSARNAAAVADICRTLDGIPLAIELAAARMRTLAPRELLSRLGDVFGLLRGTDRTALPRQRTLQGAVDWSYDSLEEGERVLWRRLSVFAESFTLGAAEAVCGFDPLADYEVLDLLTSLGDKSLVMMTRGVAQTRYHLLKTLRQYARDKLRVSGEEADLQDRHAAWCGEIANTALYRKMGDATNEHLSRLRTEYPDLRAALEYLIALGRAAQALQIANTPGMALLWVELLSPSEGRRLLQRILAEAPPDWSLARSHALRTFGWMQAIELDTDQAKATLLEALNLAHEAGEHLQVAVALNMLGSCASWAGSYQEAETRYAEAVEYCRLHELTYGSPSFNLARRWCGRGEFVRARATYEESVKVFSERHGRWPGWPAMALGWVAFWEGDLREAGRLADIAVAAAAPRLQAEALNLRGASLAQAGNAGQALAALEEALRVSVDSGEMPYLQRTITWLGYAAAQQDDMRRAVLLLAAAEEAIAFEPVVCELVGRVREQAQAKLGPEEFESCRKAGEAMSLDQAATYALEWLEKPRV